MLEGGCFCGNIRYQIQDEANESSYPTINCHCSMCRHTSGAPYVAWIVVPKKHFTYIKGESRTLESSVQGSRSFCPECGTPLCCVNTGHPDIVDVTLGSLDDARALVPTAEIFTDTKLHWTDQIADLKKIS